MGDERIELRTTFGGENTGHAFAMRCIGSKAIDRFCRNRDKSATGEHSHRTQNSFIVEFQNIGQGHSPAALATQSVAFEQGTPMLS
ncbi:hypothetical protein D9M72_558360 [compost metagenome]